MTGSEPETSEAGPLRIGGVSALEVADRYGTPLYVMDGDRVRANARRLDAALRSRYPDFRIHYAVKANSNLAILSLLRQEGTGADCANPFEIQLARLAGFRPEDILYTGNYASREQLAYARDAGVVVNLDSDGGLEELAQAETRPLLSFRMNPGQGRGKFAGLVMAGPDAKFGIPEDHAIRAFRKARDLGFHRFGLHMMTGSCVLEPTYFPASTRRLLEIAGRIAALVDIHFEFIDIGGGFGIPYGPEEKPLDIERVAADVVDVFTSGCEELSLGRPRLVVEPGRYLVADGGVLLARVHRIKRTGKLFVGTDAGMNTLLRPALYGAYHPVVVANRPRAAAVRKATVVGQVCENTDVIAKDRPLPEVREGDVLAILQVGAYGYSMSSQYNNYPRPAEVLVLEGTHDLIREREGLSDLIQGQRLPARLLR